MASSDHSVTVDKQLLTQTPLAGDNTWTSTYRVTVTNPSSATSTYDLSDRTSADGDVFVDSVKATVNEPQITIDPSFDGVDHTSLVAGQTIAAGATHVFTVTIRATLNTAIAAEQDGCTFIETQQGEGTLNAVPFSVNTSTTTDEDC